MLVLFAFLNGAEFADMMLSSKKVMDRRYYVFTPTFLPEGDRFMKEFCGSLDCPDKIIFSHLTIYAFDRVREALI